MEIQILFTAGCGAVEGLRSQVQRLIEKKEIKAEVVETIIDSAEEASALRFPGSPTVRINGRDVEPQAEMRQDYCLGWRVYRNEAGDLVKEIPDRMLESALEEAGSSSTL